MIGLVVAIIGMSLIVGLPLGNDNGRLAGYYLTQASPTPFVAFLSLISSNVAGYTKKTTVAALYLIGYWFVPSHPTPISSPPPKINPTNPSFPPSVGNIIGPQTFRPSDAPRYVPAEITIIACWGVCLLDMLFIYWYCKRQNAKKALLRAEPEYVKLENQEWLDLTDRENPEFVYTL